MEPTPQLGCHTDIVPSYAEKPPPRGVSGERSWLGIPFDALADASGRWRAIERTWDEKADSQGDRLTWQDPVYALPSMLAKGEAVSAPRTTPSQSSWRARPTHGFRECAPTAG